MSNYHLNSDEAELFSPLQQFSKQTLGPLCLKAHQNQSMFPTEIFKELSALGLAGLSIPEEYSGLDGSAVLQASVYDLLAECDLGPAIFTSVHGMSSSLLARFGSEKQRKKWLPGLANGSKLIGFALSEPEAGSDAANLSATLSPQEDGTYLLTGEKCWITSAGAADLYVVFARVKGSSGKDGITALIVPKDQPGLSIGEPEKKMGCELSPIGSLSFSDAPISQEMILGKLHEGIKIAYSGLTSGRINIAACANGISRAALKKTVEYVKQRKQFGAPLADLQGIQFRIAEMHTSLTAATLLVRDAAHQSVANSQAPGTRLAAAQAKLFATDTAMQITTQAVQLHGAMGYMRETGIEKLMRDAKMLQIVEGANEVQKSIIARAVLSDAARQ